MYKLMYYRIDEVHSPKYSGPKYKVVLIDESLDTNDGTTDVTPALSFEQCIDYMRATSPMQFNS
jgi:hypothetical protein